MNVSYLCALSIERKQEYKNCYVNVGILTTNASNLVWYQSNLDMNAILVIVQTAGNDMFYIDKSNIVCTYHWSPFFHGYMILEWNLFDL